MATDWLMAGVFIVGGGLIWWALRDPNKPTPPGARVTPVSFQQPPTVSATPTGWTPPPKAARFLHAFRLAEQANGLPRHLLARMAQQESNFDPNARGAAGEIGLMQFLPATAADWGIDPRDPYQSIDGAGRYMAWLYRHTGNDWRHAIAAYNWGIGNVQREGFAAAPSITKRYVAGVAADVGLA